MTGEIDCRDHWEKGFGFRAYLDEEIQETRALWEGVYKKRRASDWVVGQGTEIGGDWKLLVLAEDWCGDASNTVPVLARFAEALPNVELRVLKRDENLELMERYLTNGTRSIPIAILLDADFEPVGSWGPRPVELQEFVLGEKARAERPVKEIYADSRRWYARDHGETTLGELLNAMDSPVLVG
jgi:hypothetical protein